MEAHLDARRAAARVDAGRVRARARHVRGRLRQAQRARALIARDFEWALGDVDVIVTPTTAITAPPIATRIADGELDEAKINKSVSSRSRRT